MYGEIITIGDELTSGRALDLNSRYAARTLLDSGLRVTRITSVGDDHKMVTDVLKRAIKASRFVIVTGGLGSTDDDITSEIVANALCRPLVLDEPMFQLIKSRLEVLGMQMTPSLEKLAWMPEGSRVLNPGGNCSGFCLEEEDVWLYFLPGVPSQMRYLMDKVVMPEILRRYDNLPVTRQRVLKLFGIDEASIAETFKKLKEKTGDVAFGFYPNFPENHITMTLRGDDEISVDIELNRVEKEIRRFFEPYLFASGDQEMEEVVGIMLLDKKMTLSVAESCTGGLIGDKLTNVPGSSRYFLGGAVAYGNDSKVKFLGVSPHTLEKQGAVSHETVREMAQGIRQNVKTDLGLAVTGIAGPDGGTKEKPVGTVYIGLATGNDIFSEKYRFWGKRKHIKLNTSMMAIDWVRRYLNGDPFLSGI